MPLSLFTVVHSHLFLSINILEWKKKRGRRRVECRMRRRKRDWDSNVVSNVDTDFNISLQLLDWLLFCFYILLTVFIYYINLYFISYLIYFIDRERSSDRDNRSERERNWWRDCWEFSGRESRAEDQAQRKLIYYWQHYDVWINLCSKPHLAF